MWRQWADIQCSLQTGTQSDWEYSGTDTDVTSDDITHDSTHLLLVYFTPPGSLKLSRSRQANVTVKLKMAVIRIKFSLRIYLKLFNTLYVNEFHLLYLHNIEAITVIPSSKANICFSAWHDFTQTKSCTCNNLRVTNDFVVFWLDFFWTKCVHVNQLLTAGLDSAPLDLILYPTQTCKSYTFATGFGPLFIFSCRPPRQGWRHLRWSPRSPCRTCSSPGCCTCRSLTCLQRWWWSWRTCPTQTSGCSARRTWSPCRSSARWPLARGCRKCCRWGWEPEGRTERNTNHMRPFYNLQRDT